ncbi:MAG TPA: hypothetical protein VH054_15055 [Polyangiaceae bacterium]|nr:hypothetical protein [Polyangiaceae bacterium]
MSDEKSPSSIDAFGARVSTTGSIDCVTTGSGAIATACGACSTQETSITTASTAGVPSLFKSATVTSDANVLD